MKNNDVSVSKMSNTQSKFRNSPKTSPTNAGALKILDTNDKNTKETQNTVFQFNDLAEMLTPKVDENPILSDEEILDRFPGHYLLNCLGPGSHFGEVALTHNVLRYNQ